MGHECYRDCLNVAFADYADCIKRTVETLVSFPTIPYLSIVKGPVEYANFSLVGILLDAGREDGKDAAESANFSLLRVLQNMRILHRDSAEYTMYLDTGREDGKDSLKYANFSLNTDRGSGAFSDFRGGQTRCKRGARVRSEG